MLPEVQLTVTFVVFVLLLLVLAELRENNHHSKKHTIYLEKIMADISKLTSDLAQLQLDVQNAVTRVTTDIQSLKDQIAALTGGGVITQEQIDALDASVTSIDAAVTALDPTTPK